MNFLLKFKGEKCNFYPFDYWQVLVQVNFAHVGVENQFRNCCVAT